MLAEARITMFVGSKDESHLTRPHMRLIYRNDWNKDWERDDSVPELAMKIAKERGLIK